MPNRGYILTLNSCNMPMHNLREIWRIFLGTSSHHCVCSIKFGKLNHMSRVFPFHQTSGIEEQIIWLDKVSS